MIAAMQAGAIGFIDTPAQGNKRPTGVKWCADNGSFSDKFDEQKWWKFLVNNTDAADTCAFAVAPDVVGDARATLARSTPWLPRIRSLGYPAALVAQNGLENLTVPWDEFDCLFIGGCVECAAHGAILEPIKTGRGGHQRFFCPTCKVEIFEWKLSPAAVLLVAEARSRGKWVHMGRVNSGKRFAFARAIGCDSVDGTYLTAGPDTNLPKLLSWVRGNDQLELFGGAA